MNVGHRSNENTAGLLLYPKLGFEPFAIEERLAPGGGRPVRRQTRLSLPSECTDGLKRCTEG
jgi:hypothetical protein